MEEPHDCTDSKDVLTVLDALFDGLVRYDAQMKYEPAIAESWDISKDARTWTFRLRKGVVFHNGTPCDSEAVRFSLERMSRPDMGVTLGAPGVYNQYLQGMQIETPDAHTVRIKLSDPMADLLDVLVTGYILPPDEVERLGSEFKYHPLGTGPYRFESYEQGVALSMSKHDQYFDGAPVFDQVTWRVESDPGERVRMLHDGEAQIATSLPPDVTDGAADARFQRSRGTTAFIIIFSAQKGPLRDPRIRQALNLAIDRDAVITQILGGAGCPLTGFVSPHHFGYDEAEAGQSYDIDKARSLISDAGFSDGIRLTLDSPTSLPNEAVPLSKIVTEMWREIGVDVEIVYTEDREAYAHNVRLKKIHDMCIFDSSPLSTFRVLKEKIDARFEGSWWQHYHNSRVESLLDQATLTVSDEAREAIYQQCFRILNEDPPWLYLYNYETITATTDALEHWKLPAHGVVDVRGLGD
jgi:peptide/nickel transport system substrate-binding protein